MSHVVFGQVQRRAREVGLVMSRRHDGVHLRFRDAGQGSRTWSRLRVEDAWAVVQSLSAAGRDERG